MHKSLFFAIGIFVNLNILSATNYRAGDTLSVFTKSGLKLRLQPNSTSQSLATMKLGDKVLVVNTFDFDITKEQTIEGLKGHWIVIRYDSLEGYAFDAYLSALPEMIPIWTLVEQAPDDTIYEGHELASALDQYVRQRFIAPCEPAVYYNGSDGEGFHIMHIQKLNHNCDYIEHGGWEGYGYELVMHNARPAEVRNLILLLADVCHFKKTEQIRHFFQTEFNEVRPYQEVINLDMFTMEIIHYRDSENNKRFYSVRFNAASS